MKLLLTSVGICNETIAKSLDKLTRIPRSEVKVGFIPTAANVEPGSKIWFLKQIDDLLKFGFTYIDIVDFTASNIAWEKRLEECNVLFVSGGNTFHLLNEVRTNNFDKWLHKNSENFVYVGSSAGSILVTPTISIALVEPADENLCEIKDLTGLHYVDFEISPHTPEEISYDTNETYTKTNSHPLYAIDDLTAIQVVDGKVDIVSEGKWKLYS